MPILWTKKPSSELEIGLWKITESEADLYRDAALSETETVEFNAIKASSRKLEVLARRRLLSAMVGRDHHLTYNGNGQPLLRTTDRHISISHTKGWVAIALSDLETGIDVQVVNPKIERIASKFLNKEEAQHSKDVDALHVIWSCKEAMFKKYSDHHLPFGTHMKVSGALTPVDGLTCAAYIKNHWIEHDMGYEKLENAHLAYVK